jgi:hypothetical protein
MAQESGLERVLEITEVDAETSSTRFERQHQFPPCRMGQQNQATQGDAGFPAAAVHCFHSGNLENLQTNAIPRANHSSAALPGQHRDVGEIAV